MGRQLTTEDFKERAESKNKHIDIIGEYTKQTDKIKCKCKICGDEFEMQAHTILMGYGHNKCLSKEKHATKWDDDSFKHKMQTISPQIEIVGQYQNAKTELECRCKIHNETFFAIPPQLLDGHCKCKQCISNKISKKISISHNDYIEALRNVNQNIQVIGEYTGSNNRIKVQCNICGHIWEPEARSILNGNGCPKCSGRFLTTELFKQKVESINPTIEVVGEYINSKTKIKYKCKNCGNEYYKTPSSLYTTGCARCKKSHGEIKIEQWLQENNIEYIPQKTYDELFGVNMGKLSYDFYLPDYNYLIEFQGKYHDGSSKLQTEEQYKKQVEHDKRKKEYANKNNINLLEIWYWDFKNINTILNSTILNK